MLDRVDMHAQTERRAGLARLALARAWASAEPHATARRGGWRDVLALWHPCTPLHR